MFIFVIISFLKCYFSLVWNLCLQLVSYEDQLQRTSEQVPVMMAYLMYDDQIWLS